MATHSSVLAWRIPGMVEPGGLPSMGSHRVGYILKSIILYTEKHYYCVSCFQFCLSILNLEMMFIEMGLTYVCLKHLKQQKFSKEQ